MATWAFPTLPRHGDEGDEGDEGEGKRRVRAGWREGKVEGRWREGGGRCTIIIAVPINSPLLFRLRQTIESTKLTAGSQETFEFQKYRLRSKFE